MLLVLCSCNILCWTCRLTFLSFLVSLILWILVWGSKIKHKEIKRADRKLISVGSTLSNMVFSERCNILSWWNLGSLAFQLIHIGVTNSCKMFVLSWLCATVGFLLLYNAVERTYNAAAYERWHSGGLLRHAVCTSSALNYLVWMLSCWQFECYHINKNMLWFLFYTKRYWYQYL